MRIGKALGEFAHKKGKKFFNHINKKNVRREVVGPMNTEDEVEAKGMTQ